MIGEAKNGVNPEYLGDGVYVQQDPDDANQIWLTSENGIQVLNKIALGPYEIQVLLRYAKAHGLLGG